MITATSDSDLSYQRVLDGLLRMHELSVAGGQENAELRQVRDAIDEPYAELSAEQRETIEGLSTDLFDVENIQSEALSEGTPPRDEAMAAARRALQTGQIDEALKLLRSGKSGPASRLSFLRGCVWIAKGEPRVALLFFNHAAKLDPANGEYRTAALAALQANHCAAP